MARSPAALEDAFNQTLFNLGLPYVTDLTCGNPGGAAQIANTKKDNTRITSYRGYLYNRDIPNLTILTRTRVGRIDLNDQAPPVARGIQFQDDSGSTTYTAFANLETIVSAGSIKTPLILQHSGIGPDPVLSAAGVQTRVELPVGQNLVDQVVTTTDWTFNGDRGGAQPILFPRFTDLFNDQEAEQLKGYLANDLGTWAETAVRNGAFSDAGALQDILSLQRDWILERNAGFAESFDYSYGNVLGYDSWYLLPFSRGSVNITSGVVYSDDFRIDPGYFSNAFDRLAQAAVARYTRRVSEGSPVNRLVTGETAPGDQQVDGNASLEDWAQWCETHYRSNWHPIGTAAMMSKDKGGVVDADYKVVCTHLRPSHWMILTLSLIHI